LILRAIANFGAKPSPFGRVRRSVEIGRLVGDPAQEAGDRRIGGQFRRIGGQSRQFGIGQIGVDGPVADRMESDRQAAAAALGTGMVPFDAPAERAPA
jgi:hypothetical protein